LDQTYLNETILSKNSGVEFVSYRVNFLSNGIELGYKLELIDNSSF